MNIAQYIKNKSGLGLYFLLSIAIIISLTFSLYIAYIMRQTIPYMQEIADNILPLKIEHNKVAYPNNSIQNIQLFPDYPEINFQIGINTSTDSINTQNLEPGIYLTKSALYTVINGQTKISKLQDSLYFPKGDYSNEFKRIINYICLSILVIMTIILLIALSIISLFFTLLSYIFTSTLKIYPSFSIRFRSANFAIITICIITFICQYFGINTPDWIFWGTIILLHIYTILKISKE